ncbi:hypothetical protein C8Q79DRAFT_950502 [Trametes meyenii]|nr:hypothetical protein C8Q79DRAFT_950502 [Trametes meyenii]
MSTVLRALSKHARTVSSASRSVPSTSRAFHSPFAVLSTSQSPLTTPPATSSTAGGFYEKQLDYSSDPFISSAGHRTYVVSEPDPANTPYQVPSGAYPTSAPYQNYARTEAIPSEGVQYASTAPGYAHPITQKAQRNELPDVNPPPLFEHAEQFAKAGVDHAWKQRK